MNDQYLKKSLKSFLQTETYFNESLDEDEIDEYLSELKESNEERSTKNKSSINNAKEEELKTDAELLKTKLLEYQKEHDSLSSSNEMIHQSIYSLLGPKNERNINETILQLKIASEQGNHYASFLVGYLYEVGCEIEQNISESFKYYDISNKQGNSKGTFRINRCYHQGIGVKRIFAKAKKYYEEASKQNDAHAINNLGILFKNGEGFE